MDKEVENRVVPTAETNTSVRADIRKMGGKMYAVVNLDDPEVRKAHDERVREIMIGKGKRDPSNIYKNGGYGNRREKRCEGQTAREIDELVRAYDGEADEILEVLTAGEQKELRVAYDNGLGVSGLRQTVAKRHHGRNF